MHGGFGGGERQRRDGAGTIRLRVRYGFVTQLQVASPSREGALRSVVIPAKAPPMPPERNTPSLAHRLRTALAGVDTGHDRRAGIAVALLLAAAPALTWASARWTQNRVARDIAAVERTARPRLAVAAATRDARRELDAILDTPGVAATLDGLSDALPSGATLTRAGRGADHGLAVEVAAPDPDRLRAALRRAPQTARLRDTGQRRGDGAMLVALEEPK